MGGIVTDQLPLLRAGLSLAAVLLLALALAWAVRRYGGGALQGARQTGRVRVVASHALDARTRVVLLRRDGREHLLAVTAGGAVTVVESFEALPAGATEGEAAC